MLFIDVDVCRIQTHPWLSHIATMIIFFNFGTYLALPIWITCLHYVVTLLHKNEAVMDSTHFFMTNSLCVAELNHFHDTNALDST